jgi:hypothetical protein
MKNIKFGQVYSDGDMQCHGCCKQTNEGENVHSQVWNDHGIRREYIFCQFCIGVICDNYDDFKDKPFEQGEVLRVAYEKLEKEVDQLKSFKNAIPHIMSESYRDGYSRCSFGLDLDFQFSRTKLLIERGQYMFDRKALPELDNFKEFNK